MTETAINTSSEISLEKATIGADTDSAQTKRQNLLSEYRVLALQDSHLSLAIPAGTSR